MLLLIQKMKDIIWIYIISKTITNFNYNNGNNNSRPFKFISFSLLIDQNIASLLTIATLMIKNAMLMPLLMKKLIIQIK